MRRRVLVVDNEEADRELLVSLLQPLGFVLRTAASGHDCLDLLAAGYKPQTCRLTVNNADGTPMRKTYRHALATDKVFEIADDLVVSPWRRDPVVRYSSSGRAVSFGCNWPTICSIARI